MFISVLIPTYDYTCYTLVYDLKKQLEACGSVYEIIVMDDGGRDQVCAIANHKINELDNCRYIRNRQNVGRAKNRNNLVRLSQGEWCLIIDSDAKVVRDDFISNYINAVSENPDTDIFDGDLVNPATLPSPEVTLRYAYEKHAEPQRTPSIRQEHAYERFTTFNVMIRKSALEEVPFDETCKEYGYEDALLGIEMGKHGKKILHIDNPLMHLGFEKNERYLKKVETSLRTLKSLGNKMLPYTQMGKFSESLSRKHLVPLVKIVYKITRPLLRRNILGMNPNLNIFSFYKLGYYLCLE